MAISKARIWEKFREEINNLYYMDENCDSYWADKIWEIIDRYDPIMKKYDRELPHHNKCRDCVFFEIIATRRCGKSTSLIGNCTCPRPTYSRAQRRTGGIQACCDFLKKEDPDATY